MTKIMTLYVALRLSRKLSRDTHLVISEKAAFTKGTHASLRSYDSVRLWDLFYALMLPSGNDAAVAIAEFFSMHRSGYFV